MYTWKDAGGNRQRVYFEDCFDTDLMWKLKGSEENLGDIYYIRYNDLNDVEVSKEMWEELTEGYYRGAGSCHRRTGQTLLCEICHD